MTPKLFLYIFITLVVVWTMDGLNINFIFKKNRVAQARVFYLLVTLSLSYLVTNFVYDFFLSSQFLK
ncbi:MAG TPA: DUF1146 domain-containing protein [Candidatus Faecenecus gallistercoris]|uniref:DUF1146 domain-containing protein n=1 Tax=Candidatus Faecenecus gallistercoris TaxID=2840793 RepID=A0A9D0YZR2_9FIRM|nr:DUF1146 family protein [Bacillota bacterium]MDD7102015.1 DUF1146 family protein [Bacillota bacterium]MDY4050817.1 DUF1146 family protein [Candidatus Faecenecus gallistercoris]CDE08857.1 uncharacterized small membrane protein [Bacillus sp. CAG:988]HIQ64396.1 DUF1146 domain-containing protein [Candidatus Faecenecus gallistercoris]